MNRDEPFAPIPPLEFSDSHAKHGFGLEVKTLNDIRRGFGPNAQPPVARHRFFMLFHATSGPGTYFVDFRHLAISAGDTLFLNKGQVHSMGLEPEMDGFVLLFKPDFVAATRPHILQSPVFNHHLHAPLLTSAAAKPSLTPLFETIHREYQAEDTGILAPVLLNYLDLLLLKAGNNSLYAANPDIAPRHYQEFNRFKETVDAHFRRTRNVKDIAAFMACSPKKLNATSRLFTNLSAKAFIDERVILEIKRLLISEDISIKELTFQLGFEEPTNLVKYFKRHTGMTPGQFQRQH